MTLRQLDHRPAASRLRSAVAALLAADSPPPVWSLIATIFGDIALVRGGALSTASVIRLLGLLGVAAPAARTALSRLVSDGWLHGARDGRRSHYRMTASAEAESRVAAARIYALPPERFDGRFDIAALTGAAAAERQSLRGALVAEGFGALQADLLVRPAGPGLDQVRKHAGMILFTGALADCDPAAVIAAAHDLTAIRERRARFLSAHAPLMEAAASGGDDPANDDLSAAMAARLLLIHFYRRLALREPLLPAAFQPCEPGGRPLPQLVASAYAALLAASERWLDAHAEGDSGPLPAPQQHGRFQPLN